MTRGVYVHIPFCIVRCTYCDFNAYADAGHLKDVYVAALRREISTRADGGKVATVFFGGGTPTELDPGQLRELLILIKDSFDLEPDSEITTEANPESVDGRVFEQLLEAGFNRVSIGVQSIAPHVLKSLGRVHSAEKALEALRAARSAGFANVNADLIFGTPGETVQDWRRSLDAVISTGVDHVSAYALTIEQGTPLAAWIDRGKAEAPDEDDQAEKYEIARATLGEAGFERYEVSNWAKPEREVGGRPEGPHETLGLEHALEPTAVARRDGLGPIARCRHNMIYWSGGDYFGFGAGAHSHFAGRRSWNVRSLQAYIDRAPHAEDSFELLDQRTRTEEAAVLGLRLAEGLDRSEFLQRWGVDPVERWRLEFSDPSVSQLVEMLGGRIRIREEAFFLSGRVAAALVTSQGPGH